VFGDRGTVRMALHDVKRFDSGVGPPHLPSRSPQFNKQEFRCPGCGS
jgi:hypothetical protein